DRVPSQLSEGTVAKDAPVAAPAAPTRPATTAPPTTAAVVPAAPAASPKPTDEAPASAPVTRLRSEVSPPAATKPPLRPGQAPRRAQGVEAANRPRPPVPVRSETPGPREEPAQPAKAPAAGIRGQAGPTSSARVSAEDPDAPDPSSIIDWLLKEGANQR